MKPLVVFAYDFPHKKTQDVLLTLFGLGYPVGWVIAAPWKKLNIPSSALRVKVKHEVLFHPRQLAERLKAEYIATSHNSDELQELLARIEPELGVIAGARILKKPVIQAFSIGIINLHPGLIPEVRGLDAMQWAIYQDLPLGVTAHLIDHRVDAGRILVKKRIPVYEDDTLFDVSERLYEHQLLVLGDGIERARKGLWEELTPSSSQKANSKMPAELERQIPVLFEEYRKRWVRKRAEAS